MLKPVLPTQYQQRRHQAEPAWADMRRQRALARVGRPARSASCLMSDGTARTCLAWVRMSRSKPPLPPDQICLCLHKQSSVPDFLFFSVA